MEILEKLRRIHEALSHYQEIKEERATLSQEREQIDQLVDTMYKNAIDLGIITENSGVERDESRTEVE